MLVDETNETVELSLEDKVVVDDWSGLPGWNGYGIPTEVYYEIQPGTLPTIEKSATISIDLDFESSRTPQEIVWFMFFTDDEPWFKLTLEEAEKVYDRLGRVLGK